MKHIFARAPTRIDFAGGTLDIPPLFLFHQPAYTINAAINIFTDAWVTNARQGGKSVIESVDQGKKVILKHASSPSSTPLELLVRLVEDSGLRGLRVTTNSRAPHGSGIGASSSLAISLSGALQYLKPKHARQYGRAFIEHVKAIETQGLKIPTGYQDFFAAYYGGVNVFSFTPHSIRREPLTGKKFLDELERCLFLVYTGKPHISSVNNWELFKRHIQGHKETIRFFGKLRDNSEAMRDAFLKKDISKIGELMAKDWEIRCRMIPDMSTKLIDKLIPAMRRAGAFGWRVCGAGGGGCVAFLIDPADRPKAVRICKTMRGVQCLPCRISRQGLRVKSQN